MAAKLARDLQCVPGVVDSHVFQVPNAPPLSIDIDRTLATQFGIDQGRREQCSGGHQFQRSNVAEFWVDPRNSVSYPLVVQMPTYGWTDAGPLDLAGHPR